MSKSTMVRQQKFGTPILAENIAIHAAVTLPTSGVTNVTTNITNPDVPRTVRLKGNQATVETLVVTVVGTDINDQPLSEAVTMGADYTTATDSLNAFKTVTKIVMPTRGAASDTISVGNGASLGLDSWADVDSFTGFAGVTSFTSDATVIGLNVVVPSTTLDGATDITLVYVPAVFPTYKRASF